MLLYKTVIDLRVGFWQLLSQPHDVATQFARGRHCAETLSTRSECTKFVNSRM